MVHGIDYYGFVYIWYDTVDKRFLIGSHHGSVDDGYTTATGGPYVREIFDTRPHTMKRRILEYNTHADNYKETQQLEKKWIRLRPNIIQNTKYYNKTNWVGGGFDISIKRIKPKHWVDAHITRQQQLAKNGQHNFTSASATRCATNRIKNNTHHFLQSDFNKVPFKLYKNDVLINTFESKVSAVEQGWPAHLIDKLKKYGEWTINAVYTKYKHLYQSGDKFTYENIS